MSSPSPPGIEELQTLLDSMSTMVATVACDGRLLLVNRMADLASGLPRAELLQTNFLGRVECRGVLVLENAREAGHVPQRRPQVGTPDLANDDGS